MAEGEFTLVRKYLEAALDQKSTWVGQHDLYAMLVDVAAQERDLDALHQYAPMAEELAARYDHKLYQAIAHRAWGVTQRLSDHYDEAEFRLQKALDLFKSLNTRWQIGRTLFELGELTLLQSKKETARQHFSDAITAFEEIGALPDATRTREKLADIL